MLFEPLEETESRFQSTKPEEIEPKILEELICRFLINLPPAEKEFPRLMFNIRNACWFYIDNYFPIAPEATNEFTRKFAWAIFESWIYLQDRVHQFDKLWSDYKKYVVKIPSYGAIILNRSLDKILFNVYVNPRETVMKNLDFPKGKADEGEEDIDCAIREIQEEI